MPVLMTSTDAQFLQRSVRKIGGIPNALAAAHFLTTTPLLKEKRVFFVFPNRSQRKVVEKLLHVWGELTPFIWNGDATDAPLLLKEPLIFTDRLTVDDILLPDTEELKTQGLVLKTGMRIDMKSVEEFLAAEEYERDKTANEPGVWAKRGDIIDAFIHEPVRISFFGDTVEAIQAFDLETGEKGAQLEEVVLPPLTLHGTVPVFKYLPSDTVVVFLHETAEDIEQPQVLLEAIRGNENAKYAEHKAYHHRYEAILEDMRTFEQVVLCTREPERAEGFLKDSGLTVDIQEMELGLAQGFQLGNELLVITDHDIGWQKERKATKKKPTIDLQALKPGDHVVHLHHGIGRYSGTTEMEVDGITREYVVVEYAKEDKVYVPVELVERIDKYIGGPNPKLQRLSDANWNEVVRKVQEDALQTAQELLDLYAKRTRAKGPQMVDYPHEEQALDDAFAYELTDDQVSALEDIYHDMEQEVPMDRLLCGDVGFGKTEVCIRAAFRAVMNGYQVGVVAPTTILSQQHVDTFRDRLRDHGVEVAVLNRFVSTAEQKNVLADLVAGKVDIVIGTHRLFSKDVEFKKLGLIIIDEEQRFGVKAKEALKRIRNNAHVLTMTATPIPRTLHLSLSGVRSISTITTPPQKRKAVKTHIEPMNTRVIADAIRRELERNGQSYYVYNRVRSIERRRRELEALVPEARYGIVHGQMDAKDIAAVMHQFDEGEIDVLLATTIIENGIDMPRANTLLVESATMFGLSELYQLKGRVGRSDRQGYAYFLYNEKALAGDARRRLVALQEAERLGAGFELAMKDMEIRGVGNILGKAQHGHAVKIGMNLYLRLLNQAVQHLEGREEEPKRDISIDLPLQARIPERYMPEEAERVLLYQKLASIEDLEELRKKRELYIREERFGVELHQDIKNLFDLLEIKLLTQTSTLLSIHTVHPNKHNKHESPRIVITNERDVFTVPEPWEIQMFGEEKDRRIYATIEELGESWSDRVKQLIVYLNNQE